MKKLKRIVLGGLLILGLNYCTSTKVATNGDSEYYPLKVGNSWFYKYVNSDNTLNVKIEESDININGKNYFKIQRVYSWKEESVDFSRNEGGIRYSFDEKSKCESIVIPKELVIGSVWKQCDGSWEYEILATNDSINLPTGKYNELLKIRATQLTNRDKSKSSEYYLYFKRGIGNIATMGNGKLMTYLVKSKIK